MRFYKFTMTTIKLISVLTTQAQGFDYLSGPNRWKTALMFSTQHCTKCRAKRRHDSTGIVWKKPNSSNKVNNKNWTNLHLHQAPRHCLHGAYEISVYSANEIWSHKLRIHGQFPTIDRQQILHMAIQIVLVGLGNAGYRSHLKHTRPTDKSYAVTWITFTHCNKC